MNLSASRTTFTDAILLRAVDYGEADRIVTLLTLEHGKVALLARSARRSKRRFSGSLEPCCVINAEVGLGRGEVGRIAAARVVRHYPGILGDLSKLGLAGAALELVREAVPVRAPDARVFRATVELFERLEHAERGREELLIAFELRLMGAIGLAARLDACARCGTAVPPGRAALFDPVVGAVVCQACGGGPLKLSGATRQRLIACVGRTWGEAASEDWPARVLAEARAAASAFVAAHLGRKLDGAALVSQIREVVEAGQEPPARGERRDG